MASVLDIWVDFRNRKLLSGQRVAAMHGSGDWVFPLCLHNENINIKWRFLRQNTVGDPRNPNEFTPTAGAALTFAIYSAARTELAKTLPGSWTANTAENSLYGQINLYTAPMIAQFDPTVAGVFNIRCIGEIKLVLADGTYGMQFPVYVDKSLIEGGTSAPVPSSSYLSRDEAMALFVKYVNNPDGATCTLTSPDGLHERIIGVNNDGSAQDDLT